MTRIGQVGESFFCVSFFCASLLPAVCLAVGCDEGVDLEPEIVEIVGPTSVELDTRRTTRPDIAVRNFDAQGSSLRARLERSPDDLSLRGSLVDHLLAGATFFGRYDDFDEVDELTRVGVVQAPSDPDAHLLRASYLGSVHLFEDASATLNRAVELGLDPALVERERVMFALAMGNDPADLLPRAEALVETSERFTHLISLAVVLAEMGRYVDADAAYVRALGVYRDVSPFTLAWVSFVRGVMWGEAADRPDLAMILYRDAVQRLPSYVVANTHLSELEDREPAIARLQGFTEVGDPEPTARLAQRLGASEGAAHLVRAEARWAVLLSRHREAFLDHAAEFHTLSGDRALGLALARENLSLRRTGRAYVVAITAAKAADDQTTRCLLVRESQGLRSRHRVLDGLASEEETSCD